MHVEMTQPASPDCLRRWSTSNRPGSVSQRLWSIERLEAATLGESFSQAFSAG